MAVIVGLDECGTGAFVGPAHAGCVACDIVDFNRKVGRYLTDSKAMDEERRFRAAPVIKKYALSWHVAEAPLKEIAKDHKMAWRRAMFRAVRAVVHELGDDAEFSLIIDGDQDDFLDAKLRQHLDVDPIWQKKADTRFPAVMAAAILAKTTRDALMIELDSQFPEFGWAKNKGYGVPGHIEACEEHGITEHHRPIPRLRKFKPYDPKTTWYRQG